MMNLKQRPSYHSSFRIHHSSFSLRCELTICPCCGAEFEGELSDGCASCGARAVGPPLARPERELPAYGHALGVSAAGLRLFLPPAAAFVAPLSQPEAPDPGPMALPRAAG